MPSPPGVWAASLTPFRSDESVDVALLAEHLSDLRANGCDGALVFGTTGEGLSLTTKERIDALEQIVDRGVDPDRLLVGTGATAFPDLLDLTRDATALGVRGVLVQPPFHLKRLSDDGIFRTYDRLVQDVGDADLRLYVYHFPQATGIPVPMSVLDRLQRAYPDQLAGVKDSSGDEAHTMALCERFPELDIFAGTERLLLSVLETGGAGCISASANVTAPLARRVVERWQQDADARPLQDALTDIRTRIASTPMIPTLKRLVAERTDRPAWLRARPPLPVLPAEPDDELSSLQTALDRALEQAQPA
jgi:4-hydroxy-tetrahydrodipicolinate synthase